MSILARRFLPVERCCRVRGDGGAGGASALGRRHVGSRQACFPAARWLMLYVHPVAMEGRFQTGHDLGESKCGEFLARMQLPSLTRFTPRAMEFSTGIRLRQLRAVSEKVCIIASFRQK